MAPLLATLALAGTAVPAEPVTVFVDWEYDRAWLAAEADVLEVQVADWSLLGPERGRVRVRVTMDPRRIYRGFEHLGASLDLKPSPSGPQSCSGYLGRMAAGGRRVLVVVNREREIVLAGEPDGARYRLRSFHDRFTWRLSTYSEEFGREAAGYRPGRRHLVAQETLRRRYRATRRAFWAGVAKALAAEEPATTARRIEAWVSDLGASRLATRRRADQLLREHGHENIDALRAARDTARDPDVRRRLTGILAQMRQHTTAHDVAQRLAAADAALRAAAVREGVPVLRGAAYDAARAYLASLERAPVR